MTKQNVPSEAPDASPSPRTCGHCLRPIAQGETGLRHFGFSTAHSEHRCIEILQMEIDQLRLLHGALPADRSGLVTEGKHLVQGMLRHAAIGISTTHSRRALESILDRLASSAAQVPEGMALVPLRMNSEMQRVSREDGWQWEDLLAAAGCTEEQCIAAPAAGGEHG